MTANKNFYKKDAYNLALSLYLETGLSKKKIAEECGVHLNTVQAWLNGIVRDKKHIKDVEYHSAFNLWKTNQFLNKEIAKECGVSENTLTRWSKEWKSNLEYVIFSSDEIDEILNEVSKIKDTTLRERITCKLSKKGGLL